MFAADQILGTLITIQLKAVHLFISYLNTRRIKHTKL